MSDYYVRFRGAIQGPISGERLEEMVSSGQVSGLHEYSSDGKRWVPVSRMDATVEVGAP